ncbi:uncharacterized protein LOC132298964 [Cornus florida]|uniref:uncharacterized protein LOC132298964 n=1 Tax=Cornus florida TaxID=4283 RepID=UPI002899B0EF|nr:uncharacterized protein LOC132298964 [Cornus florida]XP_059651338.1 uncharacterized protein LOC132298964 [Cornus florida]
MITLYHNAIEKILSVPEFFEAIVEPGDDEITVIGKCHPVEIVRKLGKYWHTELISVENGDKKLPTPPFRLKMVIKLSADGKARSTALKIAVGISGVDFVGLHGDCKDHMVVIGVGEDAIGLVTWLRKSKKLGYAELISIVGLSSPKKKKYSWTEIRCEES